MNYISHLITSMMTPLNTTPKLPWYLELCGYKRIKKGKWVYLVRVKKIAQDYINLKSTLILMHRFLEYYNEPRNRTQFI